MKIIYSILILSWFYLSCAAQPLKYTIPAKVDKTIASLDPSDNSFQPGTSVLIQGIFSDMKYGTCYSLFFNGRQYLIAATDFNKLIIDPPKDIAIAWQIAQFQSDPDHNLTTKGLLLDLRKDLEEESVEMIENFRKTYGFFGDAYLEDYLQRLLYQIHPITLNDGRPGNLNIKIVKISFPQAWCTSSGTIIISSGLLSTIRSEDELVGVLAHEVAHFVLDHQVVNITKAINRQRRAEFWAGVATAATAVVEIYAARKNENYMTSSVAILSSSIAESISERIGAKYDQKQEYEADKAAFLILQSLHRDTLALSAALTRIKTYCIANGDYYALTGAGSHPVLDNRINKMGKIDPLTLNNYRYDRLVSFVTTYNASSEYYLQHFKTSYELASRNIDAGIGIEDDYLIKAMATCSLSDSKEKNQEALDLIAKAKSLNIVPLNLIYKQEGIILLRLGKTKEAIDAFKIYLANLQKITEMSEGLASEIEWTQKMIFKSGLL